MSFKIPTTVFGFVLYNLLVVPMLLLNWDASEILHRVAFSIPLPSDAIWSMAFGEIFICFVMISIFLEVVRQASGNIAKPQTHMLALTVFIVSLVEFLLFKSFGNSFFFIFLLAALIDFVVTWISTSIRARRDIRVTGGNVN